MQGEPISERRKHSAEIKARVWVEALKGIKTVSEIAKEYEIHPVQFSQWKKEIQERLPELFRKGPDASIKYSEEEKGGLAHKVGELTNDVDWLKKSA